MTMYETLLTAITVCALLSPALTAWINNHYLLKIKELEQKQEKLKLVILHKRELFENYLKLVGKFSLLQNDGSKPEKFSEKQLTDFLEAYYLVLPYIPAEEHNYFSEYSSEIFNMDFSDESTQKASKLLGSHILPTIRKELEKLSVESQ